MLLFACLRNEGVVGFGWRTGEKRFGLLWWWDSLWMFCSGGITEAVWDANTELACQPMIVCHKFERRRHQLSFDERMRKDPKLTNVRKSSSHPPHSNLPSTSSVVSTSPNANPKPLSPASCCFLFALPHASLTSHVSYPRLNALRAVVSQQQSVMTPHTTTLSTPFSSNSWLKFVLMNAS